jgi:Kef-type K+ transport system membrane component KefB
LLAVRCIVHKCLKSFVVPLVACEAVITLSVGLIYSASARGHNPLDILDARALGFILLIGMEISLACFPFCRRIRRVWGTLVGLCVGFLVPIVTGGASAYVISHYPWTLWIFDTTSFEALIGGFAMSIPGAISGAVVGFLVARPAIKVSAPPSRSG